MKRTVTLASVALAFALLATLILTGRTAAFDRAVLAGLRMPGHPGLARVPGWVLAATLGLTWAGAGIVRAPLAVAGAALLGWARRGRMAAALLAGWAGESLLVELVKALADRPRPDLSWRLTRASETSFPSGHAAGAMLLYPLLGLFLGSLVDARWGRAGAAAGMLLALGVGATRVLLGVHWASDVAAGWLLGGAVALIGAGAQPCGRRHGAG